MLICWTLKFDWLLSRLLADVRHTCRHHYFRRWRWQRRCGVNISGWSLAYFCFHGSNSKTFWPIVVKPDSNAPVEWLLSFQSPIFARTCTMYFWECCQIKHTCIFWLGFPGLICLVAVRVPVGLVFLLFMAGLSGLLECIHNLLFTFLSLRFIYSFNIFICRYICLTVFYCTCILYNFLHCIKPTMFYILVAINEWINQSINVCGMCRLIMYRNSFSLWGACLIQ